jgi:hypothetical protein
MKIRLSDILRAYASGAFGGVANVLLLLVIWRLMGGPDYAPEFLYRQIAWGGVWGLAFLLPILSGNWWLRGAVWGTAATAVALFVFKVMPVTPMTVAIGLLVNAGAWGQVASWLYYRSGKS